MAFVRHKTVNGKKYYQYVRNYRENGRHTQEVLYHFKESEIHHIRPDIPSLEAVIKYHREEIARYEEEAAAEQEEAKRLKTKLLEEFAYRPDPAYFDSPKELFDEIVENDAWCEALESYLVFFRNQGENRLPKEDEEPRWGYEKSTWRDYEEWAENVSTFGYYCSDPPSYHESYLGGDYNLWEEECQMEIDLYRMVNDYNRAEHRAHLARSWVSENHKSHLDRLLGLQQRYSKA